MNAYIALGYACNHKCRFCPCGKSTDRKSMPSISSQKFKEYLDRVCQNQNIKSITISGGEPTLQPNFIEILDFLSQTNLHVSILTNSDYLSNIDIFSDIVKHANPHQVHFTTAIHSHIPSIHDSITQRNGSFERSITALGRLIESGYKISIKHVVNQKSYKVLDAYLARIMELFPTNKADFIICGMDYCGMDTKTIEEFKVSPKELTPYLEKALETFEINNKLSYKLKVTDLPLCSVDPYYWKYFNYSQKRELSAYASPMDSNGETSKLSFNVKSDCDTFFSECKECAVKTICPGTWRSSYQIFGDNVVNAIRQLSNK